ncbi:hypothetical protein QE152_g8707 [Popillia japonica]|uniref:Uncharacterized protein n=1 Tax=Popillia japonica TaxID=7064 RepID=A0AAW1M1T1_POPJA
MREELKGKFYLTRNEEIYTTEAYREKQTDIVIKASVLLRYTYVEITSKNRTNRKIEEESCKETSMEDKLCA